MMVWLLCRSQATVTHEALRTGQIAVLLRDRVHVTCPGF
jgi:hypothetical protein